jgi:hypothetical protein
LTADVRRLYRRAMRAIWNRLRCAVDIHHWQTIRIGGDKGRECRDCKKRVFEGDGGSGVDDVKRGAGMLGGMSGGAGS